MDEAVDTFTSFTGASPDVAKRYLGMTENNAEQAIQLFFDSPDLASSIGQNAPSIPSGIPSSSARPPRSATTNHDDLNGPINIDSEDDVMDVDSDDFDDNKLAANAAAAADLEDDEAMARKMQEEFYAGGETNAGFDADGVRAPIGRTTETLVGGPEDWPPEDMHTAILQQMRSRQQPRVSGKFFSAHFLAYNR